MAASIEIANRALILIGADRITSLDDQNKGARACKAQYDITRKSELRAYRWAFAMKRTTLPALATPPAFDFSQQYQVPPDQLCLDYVGDLFVGVSTSDYRTASEAQYALEGRLILCNFPAPLKIRYVADITDATQFDAMFVDAFAHRLAIDICESLTASATKQQQVVAKYKDVIQRAVAKNAIERPPDPLPDDTWILARR